MTFKDLLLPGAVAGLIAIGAITIDRMIFRSHAHQAGSKTCDLKTTMRKLWAEHAIWMREYIVAAASDLPNTKELTERIIKNQFDIGDAMGEFYGADAGNELTILLKDHITLGMGVISEVKSGNQEKLREAEARWHKNVEDIAHFLQKINSNWTVNEMLSALNDHLDLISKEVNGRMQKDWKKDIKAFDETFDQALKFADVITAGIIKQFPNKF
jgi:hypothetical protein